METGTITGVFTPQGVTATVSGPKMLGDIKGALFGQGVVNITNSFVGTSIGDISVSLTCINLYIGPAGVFIGTMTGTVTIDKAKAGTTTVTLPVSGAIGGVITIKLTSTVPVPPPPTHSVIFKFKFDKHIVLPSDTKNVIPVNIVFSESPIVVSAQTFNMVIEPSTTAIFGTDFDLNNTVFPNRLYTPFTLDVGMVDITASVRIFSSFKTDLSKKITLGLELPGNRPGVNGNVIFPDIRTFDVINLQPSIPQNVIVETNEVSITASNKNQKLLQGFVDLNFNDNESEFWRNDVPIV